MKNILVNASNLHTGGAVAVATSTVKELSILKPTGLVISLLLSSEVNNNLSSMGVDLSVFKKVIVKDYFGIAAIWNGLYHDLAGYDAVLTVFGPAYTFKKVSKHVVGFAQPNIIYPNNPIFENLNFFNKLKDRTQYLIQEYFFNKSSELVVELDHVKQGIERRGFFGGKRINVVNSAVDAIYKNRYVWSQLRIDEEKSVLKIGIISRNYPHKNLNILPEVKRLLLSDFEIESEFYVTFTDQEFSGCSTMFQSEINNVGPLKLNQCPSFYEQMDGVIFPSLLECFSAVPIESMIIKKPLFASDLPFIRDCCDAHANYFDPLDAYSIAHSIWFFYNKSKKEQGEFIAGAYEFVKRYPGPDLRALSYIEIIKRILNSDNKF